MKIAIEAQRIFRKEKHGMDYVVLETIKELQKIDKKNEYFIMVSPGEDRCLYESENVHIIEVKCPTYALWEQIALPIALNKIKPDIVHCTSNTAPIKCKAPLILTLHDIIFLEKKQGRNQSLYQSLGRYYRRLVVPRILNKCRKIITVSNYECQHINQTLHLDNDTLIAVYNGYNSYFKPINDPTITDKYIKDSSYFFFLG
ncbi:MAG: glycosyltransferase, partial [Bacteroidaceae bacterium]